MRGYTVKKGNHYYAVVYEGIDPGTGKEKRRWYPAGARKADAQRLVTELVKQKNDGDYRAPDRITLGTYLTERWLPIQQGRLRPSTYDSYRRNIELHVVPRIGAIPIRRLAPEDLDALYADLRTHGRRDGEGGLSVKTVRYIHLMLRKALADAARKGTVPRNVATLADAPKLSAAPRRPMKVWEAEQLRFFLDGCRSNRLHPAFHLAAHTGMRRGEILGLRWCDVDLGVRRLAIRQTVVSVAYKITVSDVKTASARRSIDLDERTIATLRSWRKKQMEERLALGLGRDDAGLVFARPDGAPLHPDFVSQTFDRLVARLKLPAIRLHDLRHTHASLLLRANVPVKVVSERLGHTNPSFTISTYQHVMPGMQAEAATTFSDLLYGEEPEDREPQGEAASQHGRFTPRARTTKSAAEGNRTLDVE